MSQALAIESPWLLEGDSRLLVNVVQRATDPAPSGVSTALVPPPAGLCARPTTVPADVRPRVRLCSRPTDPCGQPTGSLSRTRTPSPIHDRGPRYRQSSSLRVPGHYRQRRGTQGISGCRPRTLPTGRELRSRHEVLVQPAAPRPGSYADWVLDLDTIVVDGIATALADQTDYEHRWPIDPRSGEVGFSTSDTGIDGHERPSRAHPAVDHWHARWPAPVRLPSGQCHGAARVASCETREDADTLG